MRAIAFLFTDGRQAEFSQGLAGANPEAFETSEIRSVFHSCLRDPLVESLAFQFLQTPFPTARQIDILRPVRFGPVDDFALSVDPPFPVAVALHRKASV